MKNVFKPIALFLFSVPVVILVFLFIQTLRTGDSRAIKNNEVINRRNLMFSHGNPFGFTDIERTVAKPNGVFRIAVIGDSFVWGDGLPYEKVWSHKLEKKLLLDYDSLEVLHWGRNGWSTLDEFNFFREHGKDFGMDLLIIGWVDNDPDVGKIEQIFPGDADKEFPLLYKLNSPLANIALHIKKNRGYKTWMHSIYSEQNLNDYQNVLDSFETYLVSNKVNALCVMTPGRLTSENKGHIEIVKPMLLKAGFHCLDLYPLVKKKLGNYSDMELQANAVNGHPGELMTEEFAAEVKDYLEKNSCLHGIAKKKI